MYMYIFIYIYYIYISQAIQHAPTSLDCKCNVYISFIRILNIFIDIIYMYIDKFIDKLQLDVLHHEWCKADTACTDLSRSKVQCIYIIHAYIQYIHRYYDLKCSVYISFIRILNMFIDIVYMYIDKLQLDFAAPREKRRGYSVHGPLEI